MFSEYRYRTHCMAIVQANTLDADSGNETLQDDQEIL